MLKIIFVQFHLCNFAITYRVTQNMKLPEILSETFSQLFFCKKFIQNLGLKVNLILLVSMEFAVVRVILFIIVECAGNRIIFPDDRVYANNFILNSENIETKKFDIVLLKDGISSNAFAKRWPKNDFGLVIVPFTISSYYSEC